MGRRHYDIILAIASNMVSTVKLTLSNSPMENVAELNKMLAYWTSLEKNMQDRCLRPETGIEAFLSDIAVSQEDRWVCSIEETAKRHEERLASLKPRTNPPGPASRVPLSIQEAPRKIPTDEKSMIDERVKRCFADPVANPVMKIVEVAHAILKSPSRVRGLCDAGTLTRGGPTGTVLTKSVLEYINRNE